MLCASLASRRKHASKPSTNPTCAESTPHNNQINGLAKKLALHFWSGGR
jgi:hypothetical protein